MRRFLRDNRGRWLWLLLTLLVLLAHLALRGDRALMNACADHLLRPLEQGLGALCARTAVSVAEAGYVAAALSALLYVGWFAGRMLMGPDRGRAAGRFVLTITCALLTIYTLYALLWGTAYHIDSFQDRSGITARGGTPEELTALTEYFAGELAASADAVPRDGEGRFAAERGAILAESTAVYEKLYGEFPFLRLADHPPKEVVTSDVLSAMDFTGFYFPFTGEANVNVDCPAAFLPATVVHEMAHQRLIASEQECNFIAVIGAVRADDPVYRYSGWLMGYVHLSNALYRTDPAAWQTIRDGLPETVVADIRDNNAYWAAWRGPVRSTAQGLYDKFLKSNGESRGVQSYGTVVDLLLAYYG